MNFKLVSAWWHLGGSEVAVQRKGQTKVCRPCPGRRDNRWGTNNMTEIGFVVLYWWKIIAMFQYLFDQRDDY